MSVGLSVDRRGSHLTTTHDAIGQSQPPLPSNKQTLGNTTPPQHMDLFNLVHLRPPESPSCTQTHSGRLAFNWNTFLLTPYTQFVHCFRVIKRELLFVLTEWCHAASPGLPEVRGASAQRARTGGYRSTMHGQFRVHSPRGRGRRAVLLVKLTVAVNNRNERVRDKIYDVSFSSILEKKMFEGKTNQLNSKILAGI